MFADYRVPQILRNMGVLVYNDELKEKIDKKIEINFGSREEIEIRAATIIAVELIQQKMNLILLKMNLKTLFVVELDWLLWQLGERKKKIIEPHHRTLTIYY
jgi:hypothetical protein